MTFKLDIPKLAYFHVRVTWTHGFLNNFGYELNLSEEQIRSIVNQFQKGECLWFDGRKVDPKNISEFKIYKTSYFCRFKSQYFHENYPNGYLMDFGGFDVTRDFIIQAPTAFQSETHRLASEMLQHTKSLSLNENWPLAAIALQLQEVAVIYYSDKLGINLSKESVEKILGKKIKDDFLPFPAMYDALSKEIERIYNVQMPMLIKGLREMRTKVLHEGYNPKEEETDTIITFTNGFLKRMSTIKF